MFFYKNPLIVLMYFLNVLAVFITVSTNSENDYLLTRNITCLPLIPLPMLLIHFDVALFITFLHICEGNRNTR